MKTSKATPEFTLMEYLLKKNLFILMLVLQDMTCPHVMSVNLGRKKSVFK